MSANAKDRNGSLVKIALLCLGHFLNDIYASFLPTFVPVLVARLGLSMTQAGFLKSISGLIHIVGQPVLGYLADRSSRPYPIIIGPIMAALGASLIPSAPNYGLALVFVSLWALGSATFHPQGHGAIGHVAAPSRLAFFLSLFSVAGVLGSTLSPLYGLALARSFGYEAMPLAALVPVVILAALLFRFLPKVHDHKQAAGTDKGLFASLRDLFKVIYPVWGVSFARDAANQGVKFFLPLLITSRGGTITEAASVLFFIMIGCTISPMIGGRLADRMGKERVMALILILAPLFLLPAAVLRGHLSYVLYMIGSAVISGSMPITAAMAQEMAPESRSLASSVVMGLSWGLGGFVMLPLGMIADRMGLVVTMGCIALLPLAALPFLVLKVKKDD